MQSWKPTPERLQLRTSKRCITVLSEFTTPLSPVNLTNDCTSLRMKSKTNSPSSIIDSSSASGVVTIDPREFNPVRETDSKERNSKAVACVSHERTGNQELERGVRGGQSVHAKKKPNHGDLESLIILMRSQGPLSVKWEQGMRGDGSMQAVKHDHDR